MRSVLIAAALASLAFAAAPASAQQKSARQTEAASLLQKAPDKQQAFGQCGQSCIESRCAALAQSLNCGPTKTEQESAACLHPYSACLAQCSQSCTDSVLNAAKK